LPVSEGEDEKKKKETPEKERDRSKSIFSQKLETILLGEESFDTPAHFLDDDDDDDDNNQNDVVGAEGSSQTTKTKYDNLRLSQTSHLERGVRWSHCFSSIIEIRIRIYLHF
jgi:hypothetical protein